MALSYSYEANIGGAIVIIFGLFTIGLVKHGWLKRDLRFHPAIAGGHPLSAYILGVAFAFGWTPASGQSWARS